MNADAVTLFTTCKPFQGEAGVLQDNALRSWAQLNLPIMVFGDEPGVAETCAQIGARHFPEVARNPQGTPLLNDLFDRARLASDSPWLCYVNADILLRADFKIAFENIHAAVNAAQPTLTVARRINIPSSQPLQEFERAVDPLIERYGYLDPANAIDLFLFTRDLFTEIPPLAVGRMQWDNWLLWKAHSDNAQVIDATGAISVIHPIHGYSDHAAGWNQVTQGEESQHNRSLCGHQQMDIDQASTHFYRNGSLDERSADAGPAPTAIPECGSPQSLAAGIHYLLTGLDSRPVASTVDALRTILWSHQSFFPLSIESKGFEKTVLREALLNAERAIGCGDFELSLQVLQHLLVNDLLEQAGEMHRGGRPLLIWGAGQMGLRLQALFDRVRIPFIGFVDSNRKLLHQTINGKPVVANAWSELDWEGSQPPFVFIASMYHREIAQNLQADGLVKGRDFIA